MHGDGGTTAEAMRAGGDADAVAGAVLRAYAAGAPEPYPPERFAGRGLVMCAGGTRLITCAWVTLAFLRRDLGCTLPVELWHLGPDELGPTERALFAELDVSCVDAEEVRRRHPARILGGWELKPYALVNSRFAEAVMLDADSLPLEDPAALFELPQYAEAGAIFWPDVVRLRADNRLWELCGVPYRNEPAWEAGQAVVDKARCWWPLRVALHMNMHSDVFYRHSHGDKDTFHLAWRMLDAPVAMTRHPAKVTSSGLTQRGFDGAPLFQHRTTAKWLLHGENLHDPAFRHEGRCRELLDELAARWTGRVEAVPERGEDDRRAEDELCRVRWFTLERRGWDRRTLELLSAHRVGTGASGEDRRWWVQDGRLVLTGDRGVTCRLSRAHGAWTGRWEVPPHHEVLLRPAASGELDPAGIAVTALVEGVRVGAVSADEAATALAALGAVLDLSDALARAHGQSAGSPAVQDLLKAAAARAGQRDPSLRAHGPGAGNRYTSS